MDHHPLQSHAIRKWSPCLVLHTCSTWTGIKGLLESFGLEIHAGFNHQPISFSHCNAHKVYCRMQVPHRLLLSCWCGMARGWFLVAFLMVQVDKSHKPGACAGAVAAGNYMRTSYSQ